MQHKWIYTIIPPINYCYSGNSWNTWLKFSYYFLFPLGSQREDRAPGPACNSERSAAGQERRGSDQPGEAKCSQLRSRHAAPKLQTAREGHGGAPGQFGEQERQFDLSKQRPESFWRPIQPADGEGGGAAEHDDFKGQHRWLNRDRRVSFTCNWLLCHHTLRMKLKKKI